ncbi:hypothetical protein KLP28_07295 [Nocardioidaceae bacterium]|nr:hypothetical protein KLP28_07295 [Nocardioidaceae bacterium]
MDDGVTRLVRASAAHAIALVTAIVGILALASVVPVGPTELLVLSLGVLAVRAGVTDVRAALPVVRRPATSPTVRRRRTPSLLHGRVTDAKRSLLAPRAPGLV